MDSYGGREIFFSLDCNSQGNIRLTRSGRSDCSKIETSMPGVQYSYNVVNLKNTTFLHNLSNFYNISLLPKK